MLSQVLISGMVGVLTNESNNYDDGDIDQSFEDGLKTVNSEGDEDIKSPTISGDSEGLRNSGGGNESNNSETVNISLEKPIQLNTPNPVEIDTEQPILIDTPNPIDIDTPDLIEIDTKDPVEIDTPDTTELFSSNNISYIDENKTTFPLLNLTENQVEAPSQIDAPLSNYHVSELRQLTNDNSTWSTNVMVNNDTFLAIDGASDASIIRVKYTIKYPNGTKFIEKITKSNDPIHIIINASELVNGNWTIELNKIDDGNTTSWIQAVSPNHGTYFINATKDNHKEVRHLRPGEARYFLLNMTNTDKWFSYATSRLSDSGMIHTELYPFDLSWNITKSSTQFFNIVTNMTNQTSILVVRNTGGLDALIQISHDQAALEIDASIRSTQYNESQKLSYPLEMLSYKISGLQNKTWWGIDGCAQSNINMIFEIWKTNESGMKKIANLTSDSPTDSIHKLFFECDSDYFIWIYSYGTPGKNSRTTYQQFTWDGAEKNLSNFPMKTRVMFNVTGIADYYQISDENLTYLGLDFASQGNSIGVQILNSSISILLHEKCSSFGESKYSFLTNISTSNLLIINGTNVKKTVENSSIIQVYKQGSEDIAITNRDPKWINASHHGAVKYIAIPMQSNGSFIEVKQLIEIESNHPYENETDLWWNITQKSAHNMSVNFEFIDTEKGYDNLTIYNESGVQIAFYSGNYSNIWTPYGNGTKISIRLRSNDRFSYQGFRVSAYNWTYWKWENNTVPWLAFDGGIQDSNESKVELYSPSMSLKYSAKLTDAKKMFHHIETDPENGTWVMKIINEINSKIVFTVHKTHEEETTLENQTKLYGYKIANYTGETHYISYQIKNTSKWHALDFANQNSNDSIIHFIQEGTTIWNDDFESNKGWSIDSSVWSISKPVEGTANGENALVTYPLGNYPNGMSRTYWATSPIIDCSGIADNIFMEFRHYLKI